MTKTIHFILIDVVFTPATNLFVFTPATNLFKPNLNGRELKKSEEVTAAPGEMHGQNESTTQIQRSSVCVLVVYF